VTERASILRAKLNQHPGIPLEELITLGLVGGEDILEVNEELRDMIRDCGSMMG
jgi:hypothetical protein